MGIKVRVSIAVIVLALAFEMSEAAALIPNGSGFQKSGKGRYAKVIPLDRDAKQNGFRVIDDGHGRVQLDIQNAFDPVAGELVEGDRRVEVKCKGLLKPVDRIFSLRNKFFGGAAKTRKIECLVLVSARIIMEGQ